ncbi:hypothetical protein D0469_01345 [Peribacillus saganii]|uniref:Uncharacterized protein n=1 Tax=Peribacillus saganii TaxID=2303992 RepID=A0A372LTG9_9BACI|nr:hypothetical protein [Peribacillus saganii]RFU71511.1 hypothetical protein D0469_01345 [Peribacillus saganii]
MNRFLKLVNFEINRASKLFASLLAIVAVSQFAGVVVRSKSYVSEASRVMREQSITQAEFLSSHGTISFSQIITSLWFLGPIALSAALLILYIFLIWYRDWFGKNTFIYRLLMLPTERINIFFAKATAIVLLVLGLIAFQLFLLPMQQTILESLVPAEFLGYSDYHHALNSFWFLSLIIPHSFDQFLLSYGVGIMAVFLLFTAILFERSFRWKGIVIGILFIIFAGLLLMAPFFAEDMLYPTELLLLEGVLLILITALSIVISRFLLNKKVTV